MIINCRWTYTVYTVKALTGSNLRLSRPPHISSGFWCAGSGETAGLTWPSCTAASDARNRDPASHSAYTHRYMQTSHTGQNNLVIIRHLPYTGLNPFTGRFHGDQHTHTRTHTKCAFFQALSTFRWRDTKTE